jgi:predicted permease
MAVRLALGATRMRLVRQLLTESILLACLGAAIGLPLAYIGTRGLATSRAFSIPLLQTAQIDVTALAFTLIIAFAVGLLFGIVPALQISSTDVHEDLKDASRGSSPGKGRARIGGALVVAEVALACVLLVGAGLLVRSFQRLLEVDLGFRPEQAAAWRIETGGKFSNATQQSNFFEEVVRAVEAVPDVEAVGLTDTLPLGRNRSWGVRAKGVTYPDRQIPIAFPRVINPGYIRAMRIPLRAGREFTAQDKDGSQRVLIVNETMARTLWPNQNPIGQAILLFGDNEWQVVGVVSNVRHSSLEQEGGMEMYLPIAQSGSGSVDLVVRTKSSIESLVPGVRAAFKKVDPNLPTSDYQTLGGIVDQAVSPKRFVMILLVGFSALALILATLGIYGVISYSVSQRTHEIGLRMALGAPASAVLRMVLGQGAKLVLAGAAIGLIASFALTRLMASLLFGVPPTDPMTFIAMTLLLAFVALLACYLPARRATKVDPMIALRYE